MEIEENAPIEVEMDEGETTVYLPASPIRIESSDDSPPRIRQKKRRLPESDSSSEDEDLTPKVNEP